MFRHVVVTAVLALPLPAAPPAAAASGLTFHGTVTVACFGCPGTTTGTAALTVAGVVGSTPVAGAVRADFHGDLGSAPNCLVGGQASGAFSGVVDGTFTWTRRGAAAVITIT